MPTGAELFVDTMGQLGLGEMFTLVGDHINEVLAAAARRGIRIVDFRHESGGRTRPIHGRVCGGGRRWRWSRAGRATPTR